MLITSFFPLQALDPLACMSAVSLSYLRKRDEGKGAVHEIQKFRDTWESRGGCTERIPVGDQ